jgi:hypothetical protein
MKKLLTWPELLKLARKHYNDGGDGIVECWTESDFDEYVSEFGPMTEADALQMFGDRDEIIRDMEADANSYREEATQDATTDTETQQEWDDDWQEWDDDWRPGDAPWNAPGMSPADFI